MALRSAAPVRWVADSRLSTSGRSAITASQDPATEKVVDYPLLRPLALSVQDRAAKRAQCLSRLVRRIWLSWVPAPGFAMTTTSMDGNRGFSLNDSRTIRLIRFRALALATARLEMARPSRAWVRVLARPRTVNSLSLDLVGDLNTLAKERVWVKRRSRSNAALPCDLLEALATADVRSGR